MANRRLLCIVLFAVIVMFMGQTTDAFKMKKMKMKIKKPKIKIPKVKLPKIKLPSIKKTIAKLKKIGQKALSVAGKAAAAVKKLENTVNKAVQKAKSAVKNAINSVKSKLKKALDKLKSKLDGLISKIKSQISAALNIVYQVALQALCEIFPVLKIARALAFAEAIAKSIKAAKGVFVYSKKEIKGLTGRGLKGYIQGQAVPDSQQIVSYVDSGFKPWVSGVKAKLIGLGGYVKPFYSRIKSIATAIRDKLIWAKQTLAEIENWRKQILTDIKALLQAQLVAAFEKFIVTMTAKAALMLL